jgi:sialidase-1
MTDRRRFLTMLAALPPAAAKVFATAIEGTDLFESGAGGHAAYRIPGIIRTPKGTLLAYCEARNPTASDWGNIDLLLRRSADGGKTWLPPQNLPKITGPHRKNPAALAQKLADESWVTYNNPVAIADRHRNGIVHILFCYEYMRAFYTRSEDEGATFAPPVEITGCFEGFRASYDWRVIATGPGHGIQTRRGRLVVPVWLSPATGGNAHRPSVTATIFSDDSGRSWRAGEIAVPDTSETSLPN